MSETNAQAAASAEALGAWAIADRVAFVDHGDRVVVLAMATDAAAPIALSGTASSIWRAVDGHRTTAGIIAEVASGYGIDDDDVAGQVADFLRQLASQGYLQRNV